MGRKERRRRRQQRQAKRHRWPAGRPGSSGFPVEGTFSVPMRDGEPDVGPSASTDEATIREIGEDTATEGRALLSDHPAVGLGSRTHNPEVNMSMFTSDLGDDDGITEPLPVLLFEPRRAPGGRQSRGERAVSCDDTRSR